MVLLSRLLFASLVATTATATKRSVTRVTADISTILSSTTSLTTVVNTVDASSFNSVTDIANSVEQLLGAIETSTFDVQQAGSFSEADGSAVVVSVLAVQPIIFNTLSAFVARKAAFQSVPKIIISSMLVRLNASASGFSSSLVQAVPPDYKTAAQAIQTNFIVGFNPAIAAYSSS